MAVDIQFLVPEMGGYWHTSCVFSLIRALCSLAWLVDDEGVRLVMSVRKGASVSE